jgi:signal transduction histidine kinase
MIVGAVLAFLATGATVTAAANRGQLDRLLDSVAPMRTAASNLLAALINQQTAVRGFVLSGEEADLGPYHGGIAAERRSAGTIESAPSATAEIRANLAEARSLAQHWRTAFAEPAIAMTRAGDGEAAEALLGSAARQRFDEIRVAVDRMERTLDAMHDEAVNSIRGTSSTLLFVLIAAVTLVIGGGIGILVVLQQAVIHPVTHLASQVRSVARGSYDLVISTEGPPELTSLATDVDTMRQRIAADLAEVKAAREAIEEAHERLEQQAAELTRSNSDLEQFAYVASHDLQEPLRKVASFCQLLQRRYAGQLDAKADQYLAFAVSGALRMQRLINDLLAFSRIGRSTTDFTEVDLQRLVAEAAEQLDEVRVETSAQITWSKLPVVQGEEPLLLMLFANLISNSLKFRRPDAPPRVHLSSLRVGDEWEISCTDNGIGIEAEFADKVFMIFQRLHPRDAYPGTGIGLAVAKRIAEYHGGRMWIDGDFTGGAAIRFTLPTSGRPAG